MKLCTNCGQENREAAQFCRFCGQPYPDEITTDKLEIPSVGESVVPPDVNDQSEVGSDHEQISESEMITEEMNENVSASGATVELPSDWQDMTQEQLEQPDGTIVAETEAVAEAVESELPAAEINQTAGGSSILDEATEQDDVQEPLADTADLGFDSGISEAEQPAVDDSSVDDTLVDEAPTDESLDEELPGRIEPGTVLQDRYRVTELLQEEDGEEILIAEDLRTCWSCQALLSESQLRFCEMCGAELVRWPQVHLHSRQGDDEEQSLDEELVGELEYGGEYFWVAAMEPQEPVEQTPPVLRYQAGYHSDKGLQRDINEDSLLVLQLNALCQTANAPVIGLFAVADGMGGHAAGEVASRMAVNSLATDVMQDIFVHLASEDILTVDELEQRLKNAVLSANQVILDARGQADMGCTLTVTLLIDRQAVVANVGDSRTYLMRNGALSQITRDHSKIARLIEQNMLEPDAIYTHEEKGVVYRCLGDRESLEVDTNRLELELGDRLLLCSDGLWDMVRDPFIEDILLEQFDPQQAAEHLVNLANLSGGEDNISVIVVDIQSLG